MTIYCKDYDIKEVIHESSISTIFRGYRKVDHVPVILKLLKPECLNDRSSKKIENEFHFLSKINAPQVIHAYELIQFQKTLLLVLEQFTTQTLKQYIKDEPWNLETVLKIAIDIAEGIGQIHKHNIIHKDIKPTNILINPDYKIKIIDFGIGTSLAREVQQEIHPDKLEGTITYISPEQTARMNRPIDYRTDLYSFGVTLYELFTRQLPFNASSVKEIIHLHIAQKPVSPSKINSDIPDVISDIILKCMEKNPEDRYKSAFGLKKDLEKCLSFLTSAKAIPRFTLALHDVYDKFHPPEKIFGREKELLLINECLDKVWSGRAQMIAISGTSGIGKSSIAMEIEKTVMEKEGYFFSVKYDKQYEKVPYYGITKVYEEMVHKILTGSDEVVEKWKSKILDSVDGKGQILIDIIPDLKLIIGEQPEIEELQPQESENRFFYVFKKFMKLVAEPNHPLVLYFDNFELGDEPTIKLITNLLLDRTVNQILVIISYQVSDLIQIHPLSLAMGELARSSLKLTFIYLTPLDIESIETIVEEIFPGVNDLNSLSVIVKQKTFGNPYFVVQLLKYLYDKEIIEFDYDKMLWNVDIVQVSTLDISENVLELLVAKLDKLYPDVINLLKVCSVIGYRFEKSIIQKYFGDDVKNTNALFDFALKEEYIVQTADKVAVFAHDRIRQLFYNLIPEEEKIQIHYKIGCILLDTLTSEDLEEENISIVNHLNYGINFPLDDIQRNQLISLNLKAALKIKNSQAFHQAIPYFKNVLNLLGAEFTFSDKKSDQLEMPGSLQQTELMTQKVKITPLDKNYWEEKYEETYTTFENLGECFQLIGEIELAKKIYNQCQAHAKTQKEKVRIYSKIGFLYGQTNDYDKEFESAQNALNLLGFAFDLNPSFSSVAAQLIRVKVKLFLNPIEKIKRLPIVKNERISNILMMISSLGHSAYVTGQKLLWLKITLTIIELTLKYGITSQNSGVGFLGYAIFIGSEQNGDFDNCYAYGQLGYEMMNRCQPIASAVIGKYLYPYFCLRNKYPQKNAIPLLLECYKESMNFGNITISAQSIVSILAIRFLGGERLSLIYNEFVNGIAEFRKLSTISELNNMLMFRELCLCLQGNNSDPLAFCPVEFIDEIYEKEEIKPDRLYILSYRMWRAIMLYLFDRFHDARNELEELIPITEHFPGIVGKPIMHLCYALSLSTPLKTPQDNHKDWKQLLHLKETFKKWSSSCPIRYEMFSLLVQGEVARIENNPSVVIQCFSQAIRKAKNEENYFLIGMGYELFARYYLNLDVTDLTLLFIRKALYFYEIWGAIAKCNDIRSRYAEFLISEESSIDVAHTFSFWSKDTTQLTTVSSYDTMSTVMTTVSTHADESNLDLGTIIEASETLSREIEFDRLVQSLMNLMIVNAGANKAFLIIYEDNKPFVYSEIYIGEPYIPLNSPLPLEQRKEDICIHIVDYVGRAKKEIVLNNASEKGPFYRDIYIQTKKPKSILCLPLLQNEKLKGILYLENTETINAFTQNHLRLLNLLSTQMAISIENAKFYTNLEAKVRARTQELEEKNSELNQALKDIQDTQNQLIQKEKLASLGILTAGIAHELKNPLNIIVNFAQIIKDNLNELRAEILTGSKEEKLILVNEMIENLCLIDSHGIRSNSIIKGMLSHSHQGSKTLEDVDVNALVDQAFGLAYYTFRKKEPTFNLKVEKSIDDNLPIIQGYPGDVLRVFINIIDNACYAIFEKSKQHIKGYHPQFEVKTYKEEGYLVASLKDNGIGIPQEFLNKVFNPFFTTKPSGCGTGLGLSIANDIIVKEHAGRLEVSSKMGEMTQFIIKLPNKTGGER